MRAIVIGLSAIMSALILMLVTSCEKKQEIKDNDIKFDTISVAKFYHLNNDSTLPSCNIGIILLYPKEYSNEKVLPELQRFVISAMFDDSYSQMPVNEVIDKYIKGYINNYTEDAKRYLDERLYSNMEAKDRYFSYYEELSNSVLFNSADILVMQFMQSSKKGNNSTFRQFSNYVFDLATGKVLKEADIFKDGYEVVLNRAFKDKLFAANRVDNIHDLEDLGYFGIEEIAPNNNFSVDKEGITYIFNKGEYSVLQSDEIRIFIPYNEILNLLKEQSPISVLYKQ